MTMGVEVDQLVAGLDNSFCWGLGEAFGDVPTSQFMTVVVDGVDRLDTTSPVLPESFDGVFTLDQVSGSSILWRFEVDFIVYELAYSAAFSSFTITFPPSLFIPFQEITGICSLEFEADLHQLYTAGNVKILIPGVNI